MTSSNVTSFCGSATLALSDNMKFLWHNLWKPTLIFGSSMSLATSAIGIYHYTSRGISSIFDEPVETLFLTLQDTWIALLIGWLAHPIALAFCNAIKWMLVPSENKRAIFTIDTTGVSISDAAGASGHIPWSMVRRRKIWRGYLVLKIRPGGWRFIPLRAFENPDVLWMLVEASGPKK